MFSSRRHDGPPLLPLATAIAVTLVLWGSAYAFIRMSLTGFEPGELALFRFTIASVVLFVIARVKRTPAPQREDLPMIAAIGFFGVAAYHFFLNWGQITVQAGTASLLIATSPVFTVLLATIFLNDHPGARGWSGIAISCIGVALVVRGKGAAVAIDRHALLVLLASLCASLYTVIQKPHLGRYSAFQLTSYAVWSGTLLLMVFLPRALNQLRTVSWKPLAASIYLGIFPAAIGNLTWTYTLSRWPASRAVSLLYMIPPVAALFGWLVMREVPAPLTIVGGAVVVAGVALVNARRRTPAPVPVLAACE